MNKLVDKIGLTLDRLIANAKHLKEAVAQGGTELEISKLQAIQEDLVAELQKSDIGLRERYPEGELPTELDQLFQQKLAEFQQLNDDFITYYGTTHGVIQFASRKNSKRS